MQIRIARLLGAARLLLAIGCLACGDVPLVPLPLASISIVGDSTFDVLVGGQVRLVVVARDVTGNLIVSPGNVTFASRNPSVVSVDSTGLVTAVAVGPQSYVVATLAAGHAVLADSVSVIVTMLIGSHAVVHGGVEPVRRSCSPLAREGRADRPRARVLSAVFPRVRLHPIVIEPDRRVAVKGDRCGGDGFD